jgi:DNA repair protein SbcD/Mre11
VTLTDTGAIYDAMGQLRERYPNVLSLRRTELEDAGGRGAPTIDHRTMSDETLFERFYAYVTGGELTEAQTAAFAETVERLRRQERES